MNNKQNHHEESDLPKLAQPAQRALAGAGIQRLEQLTKFSESEIKQLHGIGPNAFASLHRALRAKGLIFAKEKNNTKKQPHQQKGAIKITDSKAGMTPSQHITQQITELADWRSEILTRLRKLILQVDPDITEEWKWDTAVWSHKGNVVAAGVFNDHVKLNFFKGVFIKDPQRLFNAGLDAKATRAIDFSEGDDLDVTALKDLVRAAVDFNISGSNRT